MRFLTAGVLIFLTATVFGQAQATTGGVTYLNKNENDSDADYKKRGYYVGPHILGDTITMLMNKFENDYVFYEETEGAYSVEEKVILKPYLYNSVKKIERKYRKGVKKGKIKPDVAYSKLKLLLKRAIRMKTYNTKEVESTLKKLRKPEEKEEYLLSLKFN